MALSGDNQQKLRELCTFSYKSQAIWFLNAFWHKPYGESKAETIWNFVQKYQELDQARGKDGNELDELQAHRFLESFHETMTVTEMRNQLRSAGCISATERPKAVPLTHFLMFKYQVDWKELVNAAQGDNKEEIEETQRMLDAVSAAFAEAAARAEAARVAVKEAEARAKDARVAEEQARTREVESQAAQRELEAALAELKAQEDAFNHKTQELTQRSEEGGLVSRNKAKNELAQHLGSDPLPLRKAKLGQEAAVRKAERATQAAADARVQAQQAVKAADKAKADSEQAARDSEHAVEEAKHRVAEAEAYLKEVKSKPGVAAGAIWWLDRELHEAKKFMPSAKGGISKK